jgi:hypothetical protein
MMSPTPDEGAQWRGCVGVGVALVFAVQCGAAQRERASARGQPALAKSVAVRGGHAGRVVLRCAMTIRQWRGLPADAVLPDSAPVIVTPC